VTAGFTNELVEVLLGSAIVIPIAAGFLGLDWVLENAGFGMAFQTMPFLFQQWGPVFAMVAGVCWFGLLFFAGITSSLAMGTPWMGFMSDEFGWGKVKGAVSFGVIALIMGLPTVLFYQYGYFDEYDYWGGTVSLVIFALLETILFAWVFGMEKGWLEITRGADIKIPGAYKWIMKYVTPVLLLLVLGGALFTPQGNDWSGAIASLMEGQLYTLDSSSLIAKISHSDIKAQILANPENSEMLEKKMFYSSMARMQLVLLFIAIAIIVWYSHQKRKRLSL
jgi:SNF family Na+-dependent transporter